MLLHEGGLQADGGGINECNGISEPNLNIVERMSDEVDVVVTGHTHQAYDCVVTSASSAGRVLTDIDLVIDADGGEVVSTETDNLVVARDVT